MTICNIKAYQVVFDKYMVNMTPELIQTKNNT
jgi:hypothetical protein